MGKVTKFDKVVKREICQITAKGTRVFSVIDGEASNVENSYLLAVTEKVSSSHECSFVKNVWKKLVQSSDVNCACTL